MGSFCQCKQPYSYSQHYHLCLTQREPGQAGKLAVACYLIHHGLDWLLWDTGLAALTDGEMKFGLRFTVRRTLAAQIAQLGLKPADIR